MSVTALVIFLAGFASTVDIRPAPNPGLESPSEIELMAESDFDTASASSSQSSTDKAPESSPANSPLSRLSLYGYLNQAYAETDGNQIFGIPEGGTFDYRNLALQFRYGLSKQGTFIVQLANEGVGKSPGEELRDEIEIDRAYYQHRFSNRTRLRIGRIPVPVGIFNEYRDVGTLFPFYRPAASIYGEAGSVTISAESLDGLTVSHEFGDQNSWGLEATLYAGQWKSGQPQGNVVVVTRAEDAVGFSGWLETPVSGLRIGFGLNRFDLDTGGPPGSSTKIETSHVSLEGEFDRFLFRGEYFSYDFEGGFYNAIYGQAGVKLTDRLGLYVQAESADLRIAIPFLGAATTRVNEDYGVALNYAFSPGLVLKVENHWNEGFLSEDPVPSFVGEPLETRYAIVSLALAY